MKTNDLIFAAVLLGGGYLAYKAYQGGEAITDALTEPEIDDGTSQLYCGDVSKLTWPIPYYDVLADGIQSAIYDDSVFAATDDDEAIAHNLSLMNTDDDVYYLICRYGKRGATDAISERRNLVQSVYDFLDDHYKQALNEIYAFKGISFEWI